MRRHLTLLIPFFLAGCVTGPEHVPPEMPLPATFSAGGSSTADKVANTAWWSAYRDNKLDAMIADGLSQNLTVQRAVERISTAEDNVTVAAAGAAPSVTVGVSDTVNGAFGNDRQVNAFASKAVTSTAEARVSASWLLDLFGQYRRAKEGALASLDAAYSSADVARLAFLQDLATSYIDARYFQERVALSKANLESRRRTLELTKIQFEAGAASRLDVVQAQGLVQATLSEIPGLDNGFRINAHHIATLLARPAGSMVEELQKEPSQPIFRGLVVVGIPADLIRNRPDIRVAERNLAAATAAIGVAEAQLYPSIALGGTIAPARIDRAGSNFNVTPWSFGPTLTLPIFDGGKLRAGVNIATSDALVQYIGWKATVLNAIEEVENSVSAVHFDAQTVAALKAQVKTTRETLVLSTSSYKDGASSLLDVLDAQRGVSDAEANLAAALQRLAIDYVSLNVAVGSGYAPTVVPSATAAKSQ